MTPIRRLLMCFFALVVTGCAPYSLVKPERQTVAEVLSVEPGIPWNRIQMPDVEGRIEIWTIDGPVLNRLVLFAGTADGEPLFVVRQEFGASAKEREKPPVFRSTMNPIEVQELLQATIARNFQTTIVECSNLRSVELSDGPGFRFETKYVGRDEVERDGIFVGAVRGGKLYAAWFYGARIHYFARYLPEFDRLVRSARIVGTATAAR